jgi:exodeoxyribonuclease VII small subunit
LNAQGESVRALRAPCLTLHWTPCGICLRFSIVPNVGKNAGPNSPAKAGSLPFEEALSKLEAIVETMEAEDLPLETLLAKYEEGARLAKTCQAKLAEAELKIQQLEKNAAGELKLEPIQPADTSEE